MDTIVKTEAEITPIEAAREVVKLEALKRQIEGKLATLRATLLETTRKTGVLTLKTEDYTITRATRETIKVENDKEAADYLESQGIPVETKVVLDMDYMKIPIKNYKGDIPGITKTQTEYIAIRINKKETI